MSEVEQEEPIETKSPIKYFIAVFLIFLLVLWIVPKYAIKLDPEPKNIPSLESLDLSSLEIPEEKQPINSLQDWKQYVTPTDPKIREIAIEISTSSCKESKICYAKALYYFTRDNIDYINDPNKFEYAELPEETLLTASADCDGHSILLASLLESIGFDTRFIFTTNHLYLQVNIQEASKTYKTEQDWISLDATCKTCKFSELGPKTLKSEKSYLEVP